MTEWPAMWPMRTARRRRLDPFKAAGGGAGGRGEWSLDLLRTDEESQALFRQRARPVVDRHRAQTSDDVARLRQRYEAPVFGQCRVWDLVLKLGACVDPSDERLWCASQLLHVLQMLEQMEADG